MNSKLLLFVIAGLIASSFYAGNAFADENSEQKEISQFYPFGHGILEFQETPLGPCSFWLPTSEVQTVNPTNGDKLLNIDGVQNNFFIVLGNQNNDSYQYLQIALPNGVGDSSYLLDLKKGDELLRGEYFVGSENLAVVVESDSKEMPLSDDSYKKYFGGKSKYITYGQNTFGPGNYNFGAFLLKSNGALWINSNYCAIHLDWPFTITNDGTIVTATPDVKMGKLSDSTKKFSPLTQHKNGVLPESIKCKLGLQLILQNTDDSENDRPACVTPETKIKLIERGWHEF